MHITLQFLTVNLIFSLFILTVGIPGLECKYALGTVKIIPCPL